MRIGQEYTVLEVIGEQDGRSSIRIHLHGDVPTMWDSAMFESTDSTIPLVWVARLSDNGSLRLAPPRWVERGFWERYFDGEAEAVAIFEADRAVILRESGGVDWARHQEAILMRASDQLRGVLREAERLLTAHEAIREILEVGEPGTAFEVLCRPYEVWEPPTGQVLSPPYEDLLGRSSYEICPRCGVEFGNDDNPGTAPPMSFEAYRLEWEAGGRPWVDRSAVEDGGAS